MVKKVRRKYTDAVACASIAKASIILNILLLLLVDKAILVA